MIKAERQEKILETLEERGTVTVKEVADALDVSEMTVRRDFEELAGSGELVRVRGGARAAAKERSVLHYEYSHTEKQVRHVAEKLEVARRAVELVEEGSTIFLSPGTTVEQMAPLLPRVHLRIITNAIEVFNILEPCEEYELYLVGGMYRRRSKALVGPMAEDALSGLGIDAAFTGANGVCGNTASVYNVEEGHVNQMALDMADERYLLTDASKIGRRDFYTYYQLSGFDALICDGGMTPEQRAAVEEYTNVIA